MTIKISSFCPKRKECEKCKDRKDDKETQHDWPPHGPEQSSSFRKIESPVLGGIFKYEAKKKIG